MSHESDIDNVSIQSVFQLCQLHHCVIVEKKVMIRAFEKTGISLKVDGSEDATKMHFQGQEVGVPDGLELN